MCHHSSEENQIVLIKRNKSFSPVVSSQHNSISKCRSEGCCLRQLKKQRPEQLIHQDLSESNYSAIIFALQIGKNSLNLPPEARAPC